MYAQHGPHSCLPCGTPVLLLGAPLSKDSTRHVTRSQKACCSHALLWLGEGQYELLHTV